MVASHLATPPHRRLVLPKIQLVSTSRLAAATGLSPGYCALGSTGSGYPLVVIGPRCSLLGCKALEWALRVYRWFGGAGRVLEEP